MSNANNKNTILTSIDGVLVGLLLTLNIVNFFLLGFLLSTLNMYLLVGSDPVLQ